MTLDEATEYAEKFMSDYAKVLLESTLYVERGKPTDQHAFDVAEQKEAQMVRTLAEALASAGIGTCRNISDPPNGFLCSECGWGDFNEPSHLLKDAKHCPNCGRKVER